MATGHGVWASCIRASRALRLIVIIRRQPSPRRSASSSPALSGPPVLCASHRADDAARLASRWAVLSAVIHRSRRRRCHGSCGRMGRRADRSTRRPIALPDGRDDGRRSPRQAGRRGSRSREAAAMQQTGSEMRGRAPWSGTPPACRVGSIAALQCGRETIASHPTAHALWKLPSGQTFGTADFAAEPDSERSRAQRSAACTWLRGSETVLCPGHQASAGRA